MPAFKPSVKIVFVAAPDSGTRRSFFAPTRAHSVAQWQDYLAAIPKPRTPISAKQALAALLLKEGEDGLSALPQVPPPPTRPVIPTSRRPTLRADQVRELLPANEGAAKLRENVRAELVLIADKARAELQAYKQALAGHTSRICPSRQCPPVGRPRFGSRSPFRPGSDSAERDRGRE